MALRTLMMIGLMGAAVALAGCRGGEALQGPAPATPFKAMLPAQVRIHPFTSTRGFAQGGGVTGIDARVVALDAFGDETKAFGTFRFELYAFAPRQADPRGARLYVWRQDLGEPQLNAAQWDNISRSYRFELRWDEPIPAGQKLVLVAVFEGGPGPRLFDQRILTSGE